MEASLHLLQRLLFQPAPLLELLGYSCTSSPDILLFLQAARGHLGLLMFLLPLGLKQPSLPQGAVCLVLERQREGGYVMANMYNRTVKSHPSLPGFLIVGRAFFHMF